MEALIVFAVIVVIMLILGISGLAVMKIFFALLALALVLMTMFFIFSAVLLLLSRRCRGDFVRIDKEKRYETAVYSADGEEYRNLFPAEPIMRGMIYKPGERTLFLFDRAGRRFVYDVHSVLIITLGLALSLASLGALAYSAVAFGLI